MTGSALVTVASDVAASSDEERIAFIKRDRWIPLEQSTRALNRIRNLLVGGSSLRTLGVLIWGPSNSGKSAILEKAIREFGGDATRNEIDGTLRPAILALECPTEADEGRLLDELAVKIDAFYGASSRIVGSSTRVVQRHVYGALADLRPRALAIDNINNFTVYAGRGQARSLNALRRLVSVNKVAPILLGTEAAQTVITADRQLLERLALIQLKPLAPDGEFLSFTRKYAATLPLKRFAKLSDDALQEIWNASDGLVGRIVVMLKEAATFAVQNGDEDLTLDVLTAESVKEGLAAIQLANKLKFGGSTKA